MEYSIMIYNHYDVKTLLGKGHSANVYLVSCLKTEQDLAMKIWKRNFFSSFSEYQILELLKEKDPSHPGYQYIVHVHDYILDPEQEDSLCLLFPLYEGTLLDILSQYEQGMPEEMVRELTRQVCLGLSYVHKCGIIHTDIKLENILYRREGDRYQYAICDFGNSMMEKNPHPSVIQTTQYRCMESILEMYPYTTVSDMTSIGCVLYEMATGNYLLEVSSQDEDYNPKTHAKLLVDLVGKEGFEGLDVPPILEPYLTTIPSCSISPRFGTQWVDLIVNMIHPIQSQRISAQDVVKHLWVNK